jgi:hypothetical protein
VRSFHILTCLQQREKMMMERGTSRGLDRQENGLIDLIVGVFFYNWSIRIKVCGNVVSRVRDGECLNKVLNNHMIYYAHLMEK